MSGSRMGRGRAGRFALLSGAIISVVFIVMAYRSTSAEMARLRELHVQCAQQQESLAAQLQVVFDYKEQLEKTLSNEKSANAAAKEELQKKASRERSLRDKDSHEAMQRFNSLQQNYNILKTEHDDLKDDCSKKEKVALANAKELEAKLVELRKKAAEDKKSIDHLKNRLEAIEQERDQIQERHDSLKKTQDDDNGEVEHLQKQVHQLERELEEAKKSAHSSIGRMGNDNSQLLSRLQANDPSSVDNELPVGAAPENNNIGAPVAAEPDPYNNNNNQQMQVIRPSSQQQVSRPSDELQGGQNPQPLQAPENNRHLDDAKGRTNNNSDINANDANKNEDEQRNDVRFENRDGNIVPVGPNEPNALPVAYERQQPEQPEQPERVLAPPGQADGERRRQGPSEEAPSSKEPAAAPKPQGNVVQSAEADFEQDHMGDLNDFD